MCSIYKLKTMSRYINAIFTCDKENVWLWLNRLSPFVLVVPFFSVKCFLSKANRAPIQPYLLKNTTTSLCFLCLVVQIRKKEHLPSPRETNNFTLTHEQLIKYSHSWNTLNRKLGFITEWCTKWQSLARENDVHHQN